VLSWLIERFDRLFFRDGADVDVDFPAKSKAEGKPIYQDKDYPSAFAQLDTKCGALLTHISLMIAVCTVLLSAAQGVWERSFLALE